MNARDLRLNDLHTLTRMKYIIPNQSQLESVLNQPNDNLSNLAKYNNLLKKKNISNESDPDKLYISPLPLKEDPPANNILPHNIEEKKRKRKRFHIEK